MDMHAHLRLLRQGLCALLLVPIGAVEAQTTLYPDVPFDVSAAQHRMEAGSASIEGVAYGFRDDMPALPVVPVPIRMKSPLPWNRVHQAGIEVSLFPVTPYLEAWLKLKKRREGGFTARHRRLNSRNPTRVMMSSEAVAVRRIALADHQGRFSFPNLKPGRYLLHAFMDFTVDRNRLHAWDEHAMTSAGPALIQYQQWEAYSTRQSPELMALVEVKEEGELKRVKLRERIFFFAL